MRLSQAAVADPRVPTAEVVAQAGEGDAANDSEYIGRPYRVWRCDPELARRVNDFFWPERLAH